MLACLCSLGQLYDNRPACQAFPISPWWLSSVTGRSRWCRVRLEGFSRLVLVTPWRALLRASVFFFCFFFLFFVFFFFFFCFLEGVPEPPLLGGVSLSFLLCASRVAPFLLRRGFYFFIFIFYFLFLFFFEGVPEPPLPVESRSSTPRASRVQRFLFFLALEKGKFFFCVCGSVSDFFPCSLSLFSLVFPSSAC